MFDDMRDTYERRDMAALYRAYQDQMRRAQEEYRDKLEQLVKERNGDRELIDNIKAEYQAKMDAIKNEADRLTRS